MCVKSGNYTLVTGARIILIRSFRLEERLEKEIVRERMLRVIIRAPFIHRKGEHIRGMWNAERNFGRRRR